MIYSHKKNTSPHKKVAKKSKTRKKTVYTHKIVKLKHIKAFKEIHDDLSLNLRSDYLYTVFKL